MNSNIEKDRILLSRTYLSMLFSEYASIVEAKFEGKWFKIFLAIW